MLSIQAAFYTMKLMRFMFDLFSGYGWGKWRGTLSERKWIKRFIFLETVAGVPGETMPHCNFIHT